MDYEDLEDTVPFCPLCEGSGMMLLKPRFSTDHRGRVCDLCEGKKKVDKWTALQWQLLSRERGSSGVRPKVAPGSLQFDELLRIERILASRAVGH